MDAFIVLTSSGQILIERYYKNGANRSWIDGYLTKLRTSGPLIHEVLHPVVSIDDETVLLQVLRNDLLFIGMGKQELPAMLLIEATHRMADNIARHFDEPNVSELLIKSHYSSVLSLVDEMLDNGMPSILEANTLQSLVVVKSPITDTLQQLISPSRFLSTVSKHAAASIDNEDVANEGLLSEWGSVGSGSGNS